MALQLLHRTHFQCLISKSLNCFTVVNLFRKLTFSIAKSSFYFHGKLIKHTRYLSHSLVPIKKISQNSHHVCIDSKYIIGFSCVRNVFRSCNIFNSFQSHNQSSEDSELLGLGYIKDQKALYKHPGSGHNVLIIQPRNKEGRNWENKSTAELKLSEAAALIKTLVGWTVCEMHIVNSNNLQSTFVFGKGNLEMMKAVVRNNQSITAVFIGIDILTAIQNAKLEGYFKVQVFDRYQIILQIFHEHAHTREAKLQLALAEIPYLRIKLASFSHTRDASTFSGIQHVGGDGETYMEMRRRLLNEREIKLKKALEKIKSQREFLRLSESRNTHPIVAVVGYTNCGKTTLIKSLTNDNRLKPEDKLFATLDVTLHPGFLPSSQKVLYIDTVGFISDVPTSLIQSFRSTLEEITLADLVIHVRDISHPNSEAQKKAVLKTLEELNLSDKLLESIIEVKNKIDLVNNLDQAVESDSIYISATEGTGLPDLLEKVEQQLLENTDRSIYLVRVPNGGKEYSWILKEAAIRDAMADNSDPNYLILEIVISSSSLSKFKHIFGDLTIKIEDLRH